MKNGFIRWEDADADLISLGVDYIQSLSKETQLFAGIGLGTMSYEAQDMRARETVYTALEDLLGVEVGIGLRW